MLKQRVIGALVLLALIIIFVPMLFNRQDDARKVAVEAPPQPAAPTVPSTEVQPVQTPEAPPVVVVPDEPAKPLGKPQTPIAGTAGPAATCGAGRQGARRFRARCQHPRGPGGHPGACGQAGLASGCGQSAQQLVRPARQPVVPAQRRRPAGQAAQSGL